MNNLHVTLTEFRNESRILKEARTLLKTNTVKVVNVAALHGDGLAVRTAAISSCSALLAGAITGRASEGSSDWLDSIAALK